MLAGETVNAVLGTMPNGTGSTTVFDVTVDTNIPKGDVLVQNQARATATGLMQTIGNVVDTVIDRAPQVKAIFVNGSTWYQTFRDYLAHPSVDLGRRHVRLPSSHGGRPVRPVALGERQSIDDSIHRAGAD